MNSILKKEAVRKVASEAILKIKESEEKAALMKREAADKVKGALAAARIEGERMVSDAHGRAKEIMANARAEAETEATDVQEKRRSGARVESGLLTTGAKANMDTAVDVIAKRVKQLWQ